MDSDRTKLRYPWGVLRDMTLERIPSLPEPSGIDGEVGRYLRRLHASLQEHLAMRPLDFQNLVDGFSYASTTHATTHSSGGTDEVNHDNLAGFVANEHLLTAAIDHDALLNFVANEHLPGIDEDLMTSDSAVHVPTQQSVKAYVDTEVAGAMYTTSALKVYPENAAPILVQSAVTAWTYGAYTEIVPADTITNDSVIVGVKVTRDDTVTGEWEIMIGYDIGGGDVDIMSLCGDSEDDYNAGSVLATAIPVKISANAQVIAKVTDVEAAVRNYQVKILYHELPL